MVENEAHTRCTAYGMAVVPVVRDRAQERPRLVLLVPVWEVVTMGLTLQRLAPAARHVTRIADHVMKPLRRPERKLAREPRDVHRPGSIHIVQAIASDT